MSLGSGIPDPGVKKHPIPDPGSGSATLLTGQVVNYTSRQVGWEKTSAVDLHWDQMRIQILIRLCRYKVLNFYIKNILQVGNNTVGRKVKQAPTST
jgi:hypothetical protein